MRTQDEPRHQLDDEIPASLRREVRLLGDVLGRVIAESGGQKLFDDVERLRQATIALRREPISERRRAVLDIVNGFGLSRAEQVARAFTVYFQLVNLAEEHYRVRAVAQRSRDGATVDDSIEVAVASIRAHEGEDVLETLVDGLMVTPVLTAHPTEARRRAVVEALQRVAAQLQRYDDATLSRSQEADLQRRLHEEVAILWRTAQLRAQRPTPLDEVRRLMAVFDEALFRVVPVIYRELDRALSPDDVGLRPPMFAAFLRWGSWVGGDRDGNPSVTAEASREALAIQSEHLLRGLEAASRRIGRSLTASATSTPPSGHLLALLDDQTRAFPKQAAALRRRAPDQPHRQALTLLVERLQATRMAAPRQYPDPADFLDDLLVIQRSLHQAGAPRLAYGELQHLIWQAETFGFHFASLEVRQHSSVHAEVLEELAPGCSRDPARLERLAAGEWIPATAARTSLAREVLDTFAAMAGLQGQYGVEACRRYVVSFTRSAADLVAVRALARLAVPHHEFPLDVVPLFETHADLDGAVRVLDELLALPGEAARLDAGGRRLEVMLGYSDPAKDAGFLAANLAVFRAQAQLTDWARRHDVKLTLFHGRGGALGRGGGPANRAVRGQAPGSVAGRFKVTEQGEMIFARYRSVALASRHLEQVTNAVLASSTPSAEADGLKDRERFTALAGEMERAAQKAYRALVEQPGFAEFFARATPSAEIERLELGSRPDHRSLGTDLASLRAIPWVFAWGQSRCNLPGWYSLGSGLEAVAHGPGGLEELQAMYREWPFFTSLIENAEMSLVKADWLIAELYLQMGNRPDLAAQIEEEFRRTIELVLAITGRPRLLDNRPLLRRAVQLRNPYVDALSYLQLRYLQELRARPADEDEETLGRIAELVLVSVNGVAAGLQNTG
jgi:phosphoenolpyruvate carboxylase